MTRGVFPSSDDDTGTLWPELPRWEEGREILGNRCRIDRIIGEGALGIVYKATHSS